MRVQGIIGNLAFQKQHKESTIQYVHFHNFPLFISIPDKLVRSDGRDLKRALFSLKQIFQEDKELVQGFVSLGGLNCLVQIGSEADQNYQNYILRALGQVSDSNRFENQSIKNNYNGFSTGYAICRWHERCDETWRDNSMVIFINSIQI